MMLKSADLSSVRARGLGFIFDIVVPIAAVRCLFQVYQETIHPGTSMNQFSQFRMARRVK